MARMRKNTRAKGMTAAKGIVALLLTIGIFYAALVMLTVIVKLLQG